MQKKIREFTEAMKLWFEEREIVTLRSRLSLIYDDVVTDITRNNIADYYTNKKMNLIGNALQAFLRAFFFGRLVLRSARSDGAVEFLRSADGYHQAEVDSAMP